MAVDANRRADPRSTAPKKGAATSWRLLLWVQFLVLAVIAVVDYVMGEAAQTLNGYEILRRSVALPLGIPLPVVSERYILLQDAVAPFALAWAWLLYLLWALVFALPIFLLVRWLRMRSTAR